MPESPSQPLSRMAKGQGGYVVALHGGRGFQQRIAGLGLRIGSRIDVVHNDNADGNEGPVVVLSGETQLTIGRGRADKIRVRSRVMIRDLQIGQKAQVTGYVTSDRDYRHKLLRMGMVKGAEFKLVRVAPLGDPVVIEVRGSNLTLRKTEANAIEIEVIAQP